MQDLFRMGMTGVLVKAPLFAKNVRMVLYVVVSLMKLPRSVVLEKYLLSMQRFVPGIFLILIIVLGLITQMQLLASGMV